MRFLSRRSLAVPALAAAGVLWGTSFLFGKLAFAELPVSQVVLYRCALASLVLLPIAFAQRIAPSQRDLPLFLVIGALMVPGTFLVQFTGLSLTSAASAALIIGCLPPLLAIATALIKRERLTARTWCAVVLSSIGIAFLVGSPGANHSWIGDRLVFLSLFAVIAWVMLSKPLVMRYPPIAATAYFIAFGTLLLLPISWAMDGAPRIDLSPAVWAALVGLGVLCTALTYALWNWGLQHASVAYAGVYVNLEPLTGAILGVVVLNEALSPGLVGGGTLVILAAVLASLPQEQPRMAGRTRPVGGRASGETDPRV